MVVVVVVVLDYGQEVECNSFERNQTYHAFDSVSSHVESLHFFEAPHNEIVHVDELPFHVPLFEHNVDPLTLVSSLVAFSREFEVPVDVLFAV
jgi:hypothetical protein